MDLRQLEMFLAVVDEGGFNKAASKLYVVQSAVSRQITLLEHELGQDLFLRTGNRTILTAVGEALVRQARLIFRQIRIAQVEILDTAELRAGELCIGTGVGACKHLLPPILRKFRQKYPKVRLRIVISALDEMISQIKDGRMDLGVMTLPVREAGLSVVKLLTEELVVVVASDHPWKKRQHVNAAELSDAPFIMIGRATRVRGILDAFFHEVNLIPHIEMEFPNFSVIKPMVEINLGISIIPLTEAIDEAKEGRLHILRIKGKRLQRELGLVHLKSASPPRLISEMIMCFGAKAKN